MTDTPTTTAFTGGLVWTAGYSTARRLDVLVAGRHIVDVAAPGSLAGRADAVVDIGDRLLVPGFQDAHLHLGTGGADLLTCNLSDLRTPEAVFAAISDYARSHPDLPWLVGGGWDREVFPYPEGPTRQQLDDLVGDRPAYFAPYDRHGAWVSSAALRMAHVDRDTPDPVGGFIRRDRAGAPTGMVEEEAVGLLRAVMPTVSTEDQKAAVLRAQDHLLPMGITSVQDAIVGTGLGMLDQHEAFRQLVGAGQLRLRLTAALWWDAARGTEQVDELVARRRTLEEAAGPDRVIADTVKMMVDGADLLFMDAEQVRQATIAADAAGFAVHYHCYGDASTRSVLDAIEAAIATNGPRERRHHIAHLFVVDEHDFSRFARLGVTANVQGFWAGSFVPHDHLGHASTVEHPETMEYPLGRLRAAGTRLAAGSDWPVTTPDPLVCSITATGHYLDAHGRKDMAEADRLDLPAMFEAYTTGSAFVNGRAQTTGRIAPGYLADLVVLDRDVLTVDAAREAHVDQTWIDGRLVFEREQATP